MELLITKVLFIKQGFVLILCFYMCRLCEPMNARGQRLVPWGGAMDGWELSSMGVKNWTWIL